jgi:hypothetical protein
MHFGKSIHEFLHDSPRGNKPMANLINPCSAGPETTFLPFTEIRESVGTVHDLSK